MVSSRTSDFFEVGIRYLKTQEDGSQKNVTEKYVIDALSFGEAEASAIKEMSVYISGDYKLTSNVPANYHEVVTTDATNADKWYKVRCAFISIDEKTEKEKRSTVNYLVQASSLRNALDNFDSFMGGTMLDYEVVSVQATKLMDVFFHEDISDKSKEETNGDKSEESTD